MSAHPIASLEDSLLGWASKSELDLAQRLTQSELVCALEAGSRGLSTDEQERLERLYGIFLQRQLAAGADLEALLRLSPALSLLCFVSRARELVLASNFAAELAGGLGIEAVTEQLAEVLPRLVPEVLEHYHLGHDRLNGHDAVTQLAWQAGIIDNEIPVLLEYLDNPEDPALQEQYNATTFAQGLELAPELFQPLLDGVQAIREFAGTHPGSWYDRNRNALNPRLPLAIEEAVVAELRERPIGTVERQSAVGVAGREIRPRIIYDARRQKVCLRLPEQRLPEQEYPGVEKAVSWRVSVEGTTTIYRTAAAWGDHSGFSEALDITIERPVRELTVQDMTHGLTWVVPVIHGDDACLIFTASGANISDKMALHHNFLQVLVPEDVQLMDVVTDQELAIQQSHLVTGWTGWILHEIDAEHATSLACVEHNSNKHLAATMEAVRAIDTRQRVIFRHPELALPSIRSASGLPVYAESLFAEFPPTPSGQVETWYLSISAYAGVASAGEEITAPEAIEVPAEGGSFAVFDPELYDAPWVGEYLIRLRGPRNESFRHEFAIVEGANAQIEIQGASRSFRIPTAGGLSQANLRLRPGPKHFDTDLDIVHLEAQAAATEFTVITEEGDQLPLRFSPPRLQFELPIVDEPPMWRASRVSLKPRMLDAAAEVRIRAEGDVTKPIITLRNSHGAPLHTLRLTPQDAVTYVAPLEKIANASTTLPSGSLDFEWTDQRAGRKVSVTLADIQSAQPPQLSLEEGTVLVDFGEQPASYDAAWVWPLTAPWAPTFTFDLHAATHPETGEETLGFELPACLVDAGNLAVQLHSSDSFMTLRPPVSPGECAAILEQPGYFRDDLPALVQLSAFLAGESDEVPESDTVMPLLWDLITTGVARRVAKNSVHTVLRAQPDAALSGLAESLVPAEKQPGLIVESSLARCVFGATKYTSEDTDYHRAAWIGALELLGEIDRILSQSQQEQDSSQLEQPAKANDVIATTQFISRKVNPKLQELYTKLDDVAGENLLKILATGRDATLDSACIDRSTVAIASMDEAQQKNLLAMFFAGADIVPGAIMDDGSRLLAVFETFNQREKIGALLAEENLIQPAVSLLRTLKSTNKTLYAMARVRFDKLDGVDTDARENLWSLAPVVSLILALAARMHAHGMITSVKTLDTVTPGWAKLADVVSDLVTSDLVAAEAMVLAVKHQGRAG